MEHGTKWKSLQPGCINAGFRILWILHVEIENTSHSTCQLFVQDRREFLFSREGKVAEFFKFSSLDSCQVYSWHCASTALDKIRIYAVHAHVCQEFVTICITCLHTSIFFYAPRTYLSTYLFTYKIYSLVALCCIALIAVLAWHYFYADLWQASWHQLTFLSSCLAQVFCVSKSDFMRLPYRVICAVQDSAWFEKSVQLLWKGYERVFGCLIMLVNNV